MTDYPSLNSSFAYFYYYTTFNSQLSTLNSQLSTLNSQLSTLNFQLDSVCKSNQNLDYAQHFPVKNAFFFSFFGCLCGNAYLCSVFKGKIVNKVKEKK